MFGINWENFIGKNRFGSDFNGSDRTNNGLAKQDRFDLESNYRDMNFELLAIDLVNSITKKGSWEHTTWSNDENHDGVLCIAIYNNTVSKCWMEAKFTYNTNGKSLSRYRLDSTIVSKLLLETSRPSDNNIQRIKKIFIVTNCSVAPGVQKDILLSINSNGNHCQVCLYQRSDVEFWLYTHEEEYKRYFNGKPDNNVGDNFYIYNNVHIYPERAKYSNFYYDTGEVVTLVQRQRYVFNANIYCQQSNVTILPPKGITIINEEKVSIKDNKLQFVFSVEEEPASHIFIINGIETPYIDFVYKPYSFLEIRSHKEIKRIANRFINENVTNACSTLIVLGKVAVGKSTLLNLIMQNTHKSYYFISLTSKFNENIKNIIKFVSNLILPFVPWDDLDKDYIAKLKTECGQGFRLFDVLLRLYDVSCNDNVKENNIINEINQMDFDFPSDLNFRTTVLFVDNIQNLGKADGVFLTKCLAGIQDSSLKLKILLFGNTYFKDNEFYYKLREYTILSKDLPKESVNCEFTNKDIIDHLNKTFNAHLVKIDKKPLFEDLFDVSTFIDYIITNKFKLATDSDFEIAYNRYRQSETSHNTIKNRLQNALKRCDERTRETLQKIYLFPQPYHNKSNNWKNDINKLLKLQLIKIDESNEYVEPYHDLYRNIYLRFLFKNKNKAKSVSMNDQERLIYTFTYNSPDTKEWMDAADKLYRIRHIFPATVLFALEPTFCNVEEKKESLMAEWGSVCFFKMYDAYATACGYSSTIISEAEEHNKLIKWSKDYTQYPQIRRFAVDAYASLLEDAYESAEFDLLRKLYSQFQNEYISLAPFINTDLHEWKIRNYLVESLFCYAQSIFDSPDAESNFLIHRENYLSEPDGLFHFYEDTARFARTLYIKDIDKAISYTDCAIQIMNSKKTHADPKQNKILNFQKTYLDMIKNDKANLINDLLVQYKGFNEGFQKVQRKIRLALIMACLKYNNASLADDLLKEEIETPQPRNKRLEIFYWQAMALKSLVHQDPSDATVCLKRAAEKAKDIQTFLRIINHNLKVLLESRMPVEIQFAVSETLLDDIYYIDTRADY